MGLCWDPEPRQMAEAGWTGEPMGSGWETPDPGFLEQEGEGGRAEAAGLWEGVGRGPGARLGAFRGGLGPLPQPCPLWCSDSASIRRWQGLGSSGGCRPQRGQSSQASAPQGSRGLAQKHPCLRGCLLS